MDVSDKIEKKPGDTIHKKLNDEYLMRKLKIHHSKIKILLRVLLLKGFIVFANQVFIVA